MRAIATRDSPSSVASLKNSSIPREDPSIEFHEMKPPLHASLRPFRKASGSGKCAARRGAARRDATRRDATRRGVTGLLATRAAPEKVPLVCARV